MYKFTVIYDDGKGTITKKEMIRNIKEFIPSIESYDIVYEWFQIICTHIDIQKYISILKNEGCIRELAHFESIKLKTDVMLKLIEDYLIELNSYDYKNRSFKFTVEEF
jgi:hypothetical protein